MTVSGGEGRTERGKERGGQEGLDTRKKEEEIDGKKVLAENGKQKKEGILKWRILSLLPC